MQRRHDLLGEITTNKTAQTIIRRLVKFYVNGNPVAPPGISVSALRG
jgi:hypothetical protein